MMTSKQFSHSKSVLTHTFFVPFGVMTRDGETRERTPQGEIGFSTSNVSTEVSDFP